MKKPPVFTWIHALWARLAGKPVAPRMQPDADGPRAPCRASPADGRPRLQRGGNPRPLFADAGWGKCLPLADILFENRWPEGVGGAPTAYS